MTFLIFFYILESLLGQPRIIRLLNGNSHFVLHLLDYPEKGDAMSYETTIDFKKKNGNLHFYMAGIFDTETALRSATLIYKSYCGRGNVFIHTKNLTTITDHSREMFSNMVSILQLPKRSIYFTGEKGFKICHDGGRVIVYDKEKAKNKKGMLGGCKRCKRKS